MANILPVALLFHAHSKYVLINNRRDEFTVWPHSNARLWGQPFLGYFCNRSHEYSNEIVQTIPYLVFFD